MGHGMPIGRLRDDEKNQKSICDVIGSVGKKKGRRVRRIVAKALSDHMAITRFPLLRGLISAARIVRQEGEDTSMNCFPRSYDTTVLLSVVCSECHTGGKMVPRIRLQYH